MNVDEAMAYASKDKCFWEKIAMNVDEALLVAAKQGGLPETDEWHAEVIDALDVLSAEVERLRAELAAAKAASVCPVKWKSAEQFFQSGADLGNQWGIELWFENKEQREQFHKWLKERGDG